MTTAALLSHGLARAARAVLALNAVLFLAFFAAVAGVAGARAEALATPWGYIGLLVLSAGVCWMRAASVERDRAAWACAGAALLCWALGRAYLDFLAADGPAPSFSVADAFYLAFFPLMFASLSLQARRSGWVREWAPIVTPAAAISSTCERVR